MIEIDGRDRHVVLTALEIQVDALTDYLADHDEADSITRSGIVDDLRRTKEVVKRLAASIERSDRVFLIREMRKEADALYDQHLVMRDAKSNGCCSGMNVWQVMEYDRKMVAPLESQRQLLLKLKELEGR